MDKITLPYSGELRFGLDQFINLLVDFIGSIELAVYLKEVKIKNYVAENSVVKLHKCLHRVWPDWCGELIETEKEQRGEKV